MSIIRAILLNKYFCNPKKIQVLNNLNFSVEEGKLTSIIGKSGSGKSTLLYLLSTLDTDFDGCILIDDNDIKKQSQNWLAKYRNENIGFIFQFHYLLPEFSVLDNVMLPALKLGKFSRSKIKDEATRLLNLLDLKSEIYKNATQLSGGQQQRVAIARALINSPRFIIGDEPTGNLDSVNTEIVIELFKKLCNDNGQTILTVTHDNDFSRKSDAIIHLKDGQII